MLISHMMNQNRNIKPTNTDANCPQAERIFHIRLSRAKDRTPSMIFLGLKASESTIDCGVQLFSTADRPMEKVKSCAALVVDWRPVNPASICWPYIESLMVSKASGLVGS